MDGDGTSFGICQSIVPSRTIEAAPALARPGADLISYCFPAMNHCNEVTILTRTQCLLAKSEVIGMED